MLGGSSPRYTIGWPAMRMRTKRSKTSIMTTMLVLTPLLCSDVSATATIYAITPALETAMMTSANVVSSTETTKIVTISLNANLADLAFEA